MEKGSRDLLKHRMWISYCAKNRSTCKRINKKQGTCPRPGPHTSFHCLAHGDSFKGTNENHCLGFFSSLISRTRRSSRAEFAEITVPTPGAAHGLLRFQGLSCSRTMPTHWKTELGNGQMLVDIRGISRSSLIWNLIWNQPYSWIFPWLEPICAFSTSACFSSLFVPINKNPEVGHCECFSSPY